MRLWKNKSGASSIEYGMIAALISLVIIIGLSLVGTETNQTFSIVGSTLASSNAASDEGGGTGVVVDCKRPPCGR